MMAQHREVKTRYPDAILLFRVGDFYETFGQDAVLASKILGITLTKRSNGAATSIDLAGFPHHSLDSYLHKLVKAGHRVAICDQLEDPKLAKGIVKRGVTELVTPGLASSDKLLDGRSNNFLAALHLTDAVCGVAFIDISTGEFFAAQGDEEYMDKLLQSFAPSEVILAKSKSRHFKERFGKDTYTFAMEDWVFADRYAYDTLVQHFDTQSLKGYGLEDQGAAIIAAGGALHYLKDTEHPHLQHITGISRIIPDSFLWMDRFTIRNLELLPGAEGSACLLHSIDSTATPMGARLMRRWMIFPLFDLHQIAERQEMVAHFIREGELSAKLHQHLKAMGDVERLLGKIPLKKANPREVVALARSLSHMQAVKGLCNDSLHPALQRLAAAIQPCIDLQERIKNTLIEEAPALASKGGLVRDGVHEELDDLRKISRHGKAYLLQIQQAESSRTGIPSLKVAFNNVFGYYLEVTHAHKEKVPPEWIRKQTLTNAERYITPELKEYEEKILGAEEKMLSIELQVFATLIEAVAPFIACIQANAQIIAKIDCLLSFARQAQQWSYRQPQVVEAAVLDIKNGRHPVIEQRLPPGEAYVGNDVRMDKDAQQIIILTGPNMSGKSALLRQVALITLMAHMGSFVPADSAVIGLTDKIFTRVGASDNLSGGESTFMVEMNETASILNNLSPRSLVLLDEIGRGTSTYDGISIACSIVEFLHSHGARPKVIFATHYHELNELEARLERLHNYHITHQEVGNKVIFLRKLARGGSRHSFGIQVARMAGMPQEILARADELLGIMEARAAGDNQIPLIRKTGAKTPTAQLSMFDSVSEDLKRIQEVLDGTDINTLTPVEALMKLNEMKTLSAKA